VHLPKFRQLPDEFRSAEDAVQFRANSLVSVRHLTTSRRLRHASAKFALRHFGFWGAGFSNVVCWNLMSYDDVGERDMGLADKLLWFLSEDLAVERRGT
jgi:hypothetical protein